MRRYHIIAYVCFLSLVSTGLCANRYFNWGRNTFLQVEQREFPVENARDYIKSKSVYDMFKTVIHVDALWYTKEVIDLYNSVAESQAGQTREYNPHEYVFYVFISPADDHHVLTDSDNAWSVYIRSHGKVHAPKKEGIERIISLDGIDRYIMGEKYCKKHLRFKTVYKVVFDASSFDRADQEWELVLAKEAFVVPLSWYKTGPCS